MFSPGLKPRETVIRHNAVWSHSKERLWDVSTYRDSPFPGSVAEASSEYFQSILGQVVCFKAWWLHLIRWGNSFKGLTHEGLFSVLPPILPAACSAMMLSLRKKKMYIPSVGKMLLSIVNMQTHCGLILWVPQNIKLHNLSQLGFFFFFNHVRHFDVWGLVVICSGY